MENNIQILPTLDMAVLQEKANEYAMKGAIEKIKEYYTGYDSPFKKEISRVLEAQQVGVCFELPDIIARINEGLTNEIDKIANQAIAQTFVPMVSKFLTRADKEVKFSDILRFFIEYVDDKESYPYDYNASVNEDSKYGWLNVELSGPGKNVKFTLHESRRNKESKTYSALSLPHTYGSQSRYETMTLSDNGSELKIPFTPNVLRDEFTGYMARLVLSQSEIVIDTTEFDDSMFPERCHCH
ncbi:hypothetical protein ACTJJB_01765 [Chitinophaga sp. 22536]|uniref:hypothetical protein n=1 Tax=unclassified Chitinophaga TaxID=2619133 RepID=UPI003F842A54